MWVALAVLTLLVHLVVHEGAHAMALRRLGGDIREAGLGLPFPPRLRTTVQVRGRGRAEPSRPLVLSLSPWLIAAYVEPDQHAQKLIEQARYRDRAWFAGAGVVANLLASAALLVVLLGSRGAYLPAAAAAAAGVLIWSGRKMVTAAIPVLGVAALVFVVAGLVGSAGQQNGPVGLFRLLAQTDGPRSLLIMAIAVGLSLAVLNCIPIFPFDGGRVMDAALHDLFGDTAASRFRAVTGAFAFSLILYTIVSDWL